jgi:hexosaminidase
MTMQSTPVTGTPTGDIPIVPAPRSAVRAPGAFVLTQATRIIAGPECETPARLLAERLRRSTGFPVPVTEGGRTSRPEPGAILLTTRGARRMADEGYSLVVSPDAVEIRAPRTTGVLYGTQSLLQLMPAEVFSPSRAARVEWSVPCLSIEDEPRFPWRGYMLDSGRHFFTPEEVKRLLDLMAVHKLNVFHWHLTEDQGWRIESARHPRLTEVGAWRDGVGFGLPADSTTAYGPDGRYGGFSTREEVASIVAFARDRGITVVPEIEMPGHSTAALAAYPELGCTGGPYAVETKGGVFHGVYCAGREETFAFLESVLDEVFEMFPGTYIHIGGDEAPKDSWKKCPRCQERMKAEGLKDEHELQSWFIRRIERHVNKRGRTLIGWSEIREGGLARNAVVMDWIGGGLEAAAEGHDVIMSPTGFCYLDYKQTGVSEGEPGFTGSYLPLEKVYAFEPIPQGLDRRMQRHVLGGQGNLWTELVPSLQRAEYMTFPRLCALAEALWSPREARHNDGFVRRLRGHLHRLDAMGVKYCPDLSSRKAEG